MEKVSEELLNLLIETLEKDLGMVRQGLNLKSRNIDWWKKTFIVCLLELKHLRAKERFNGMEEVKQ